MHRSLLMLPFLALLAGCNKDPYDTPGTWQPAYNNEANLRAMVANPHDLVEGERATGVTGVEATAGVQRLVDDKRQPLIGESTSGEVAQSQGAGGGGTGSGVGSSSGQ